MTSEPETRHFLLAAAALLDQGATIDRLSRPLTIVALLGLLAGLGVELGPLLTLGLLLVAIAGLIEAFFAIRVGFDAVLFHRLADDDRRSGLDLRGLDGALVMLGLVPEAKTARPVDVRVRGARRLLTLQAVALALQIAVIFFGAALVALR
jgi:hypothetical protein